MQLTEKDQEVSYSQGFIERWLEITDAPGQVKEHLEIISSGVNHYRTLAVALEEDLSTLRTNYNALTLQSAQYLQLIQSQKELLDRIDHADSVE